MVNLFEAAMFGSGSDGITNYNELLNKPKINNVELSGNKSLSDLGFSSELKTVNGNSLVGAGNVDIKTYQPYGEWGQLSDCNYNGTLLQWCEAIRADTSTKPGMAYCGTIETGLSSANPPFFDSNLNMPARAEVVVQIMGTEQEKVICLTTTCMNDAPYHWEATYYKGKTDLIGTITPWRKWSDIRILDTDINGKISRISVDGSEYELAGAGLPETPSEDGEYKLVISSGAASWVKIN